MFKMSSIYQTFWMYQTASERDTNAKSNTIYQREKSMNKLLTPLIIISITLWSIAIAFILFIKMLIWEIPTCAEKIKKQ